MRCSLRRLHCLGAVLSAALTIACEKKAEPAPAIDTAALKEELKRELLAELREEMRVMAKAGPGAAQVPGADAEVETPVGSPNARRVEDEETEEALAPIVVPDEPEPPEQPAVAAYEPPIPAEEPPPIRAAREEPFLDEPAAGLKPQQATGDYEPPPIRPAEKPVADLPVTAPVGSRRDLPPAPAPFPANAAAPQVRLVEFVVSEEVDREQRTAVKAGTRFKQSLGKVYAYTVVKNEGDATQIGIEWETQGEVKSRLYLKVGHSISGWRTWSTLRLEPDAPGKWMVRILDARGTMLDEKSFTILK